MNTSAARPYRGVFPVVPTVFDADGGLDLEGQKRAVDCMIDAGSQGLCILANFSEQFVLTDEERDIVMTAVMEHVAGRVPVIVTTTHFSTRVCAERSRRAQERGAAMVMVMPPYHGATIRVPEQAIYDFYRDKAMMRELNVRFEVNERTGVREIAGVPADDPRVARARELAAERHQPLTMTPGDLRVLVGCWQRAATGLLDLLTETAETTSRS